MSGFFASARPLVLVVEDQPQIARLIARELTGHADVVIATTAVDALQGAERNVRFHAVICDYQLSGAETGVEVLEAVRRLQPQAARLMLSGHVPRDLGPLMVSGLVHRFIAKPPAPGELWQALCELSVATVAHLAAPARFDGP